MNKSSAGTILALLSPVPLVLWSLRQPYFDAGAYHGYVSQDTDYLLFSLILLLSASLLCAANIIKPTWPLTTLTIAAVPLSLLYLLFGMLVAGFSTSADGYALGMFAVILRIAVVAICTFTSISAVRKLHGTRK